VTVTERDLPIALRRLLDGFREDWKGRDDEERGGKRKFARGKKGIIEDNQRRIAIQVSP
jgi:hypothetical protein